MFFEHEVMVVIGRFTRTWGLDTNWDAVSEGDVEAWEGIDSGFSGYKYECGDLSARIYADFSPVLKEVIQERNEAELRESGPGLSMSAVNDRDWDGVLKVKVVLEGPESNAEKLSSKAYARNFVEKYLYDLFFVVNLSSPGGCDFLNLAMPSDEYDYVHKLELSSYSFEEGYRSYLEGRTLAPRRLPFEKVLTWYGKLHLGIRQQPESSLERGIFALLHACRSNADAASLVWIFHALEAIYQTKVGAGFTNLFERISFVLSLDDKERKYLKTELRRMYELRSSFVHGGYRIHHPMENEILDPRVNDQRISEIDLFQTGFNLVVRSLQCFIENDWKGFEVVERFLGVPMQ